MSHQFLTGAGDYHDILGASDILGADEVQRLASDPQVAAAIAAKNGAVVVERKPTRSRRYLIGFPETPIPANTGATISTQPQVLFKGKRLIIPSDIAGQITVDNLIVGKDSQFANGGGGGVGTQTVPGRCFSEVAVAVELDLDTAQVNSTIKLAVRNTSNGDLTFRAALLGLAVE